MNEGESQASRIAGLVHAAETDVFVIGCQGDTHITLENVTAMQGCMTIVQIAHSNIDGTSDEGGW
jgi:hypothetical protein